ncbi:MAG: FAD binding domain-containing protein [Chloroflexi bacterium]|nr:FAD binding domain-containing protein [Chloroflexota bacterium]
MRNFYYFEPTSLAEAGHLLATLGPNARPLAGGTDLVVEMRAGKERVDSLVNLKTIPGLDFIRLDDEALRLGPLVTVSDLRGSSVVWQHAKALAEATAKFGSPLVSNLATIGGNVCRAAPSAETAPPLLALEARLRLVKGEGERIVPVEQFFVGPGKSVLEEGELLAEIIIPRSPGRMGSTYLRYSRRNALDLAMVGVAVFLQANEDGACRRCRIALGAVAPTPVRMPAAEACIEGSLVDDAAIQRATVTAAGNCCPRSSKRAPADFKREMVKVTLSRALKQAWSDCRDG